MYLADTNIFLEILLDQQNKEKCKRFLIHQQDQIYLTDFTLHSIGVIMLRNGLGVEYGNFISDVIPAIQSISLPVTYYGDLISSSEKYKLDFDDAYQYVTSELYNLKIVSYDSDFKKTPHGHILPEQVV